MFFQSLFEVFSKAEVPFASCTTLQNINIKELNDGNFYYWAYIFP